MSENLNHYWGNVGERKVLRYMKNHNYKTLITSPHFRTPKTDYALDNGAFSDWKHNDEFQDEEFLEFLQKYIDRIDKKPDWVAIPDKVAKGKESLYFSLNWMERIPDYFDRLLLVVQDGMSQNMIGRVLEREDRIAGLFVGGSKSWKYRTSKEWVELAHSHEKICHIGRIGTWERIMWAERIGADSIDSTSWPHNFHRSRAYNIEQARSQTTLEVEA